MVLDSGPRRGFRFPGTRFRIPIVKGFGIPDSGFREMYSGFQSPRLWIPQAKKFLDSRSQKQKFVGFRNPDSSYKAIADHKLKLTSQTEAKAKGGKRKDNLDLA